MNDGVDLNVSDWIVLARLPVSRMAISRMSNLNSVPTPVLVSDDDI